MTKFAKQILVAAAAAISIQTCYAQWGVAAGAGVEQWNRQQELDIQREQLEMQRQMHQMEMERMRREQEAHRQRIAQQEQARRQFEEDQRRRTANEEQRCNEQKAIIFEFETSRGEDGQELAKRVRQLAVEQGKNGCISTLSSAEFKSALDKLFDNIRGTRITNEKIAKFMESKKQYNTPENAAMFNKELDQVLAESSRGELTLPSSLDGTLALTHDRVLKRIMANKQSKTSKKNI